MQKQYLCTFIIYISAKTLAWWGIQGSEQLNDYNTD